MRSSPERFPAPQHRLELIILHAYSTLAQGGFAWVYEVRSAECAEPEAVKVVSKAALSKHKAREKVRWPPSGLSLGAGANVRCETQTPCQLSTEIRIHRSLKHTNIVDFRHFFEDSLNVYIILELCESQVRLCPPPPLAFEAYGLNPARGARLRVGAVVDTADAGAAGQAPEAAVRARGPVLHAAAARGDPVHAHTQHHPPRPQARQPVPEPRPRDQSGRLWPRHRRQPRGRAEAVRAPRRTMAEGYAYRC